MSEPPHILAEQARAAGVDLNQATNPQLALVLRLTVCALEELLDTTDLTTLTSEALVVIHRDISEIIARMRNIDAALLASREGALVSLRQARIQLDDARNILDSGRRGMMFYQRLERVRKHLAEATQHF